MTSCRILLLVLLTLLSAGSLSLRAATLSGTVRDPSGAAAFNAQVIIRSEAGGEEHSETGSKERRISTDKAGHFEADLPPGAYQVRIELAGFVTVERRVVIEPSQPASVEIDLELAETRTELNVPGKGSTLANSDPNYRALRDNLPKETYAVSNLVLKRDVGSFILKSGHISFVPAVLGRVTMAAFSGEGEFTLEPAVATERGYLHMIADQDTVRESFNRLVLCFTDDTYQEIRSKSEKGPDVAPERDVLNDFRKRVRRRSEDPRSMLEYLLTYESVDNVDADILADLYNPKHAGFFSAYIFGRKHSDLRFHVRPRSALIQLGPEEVALISADVQSNQEGIWYLAHFQNEYKSGRPNSREEKREIHVERYRIETAISRRERLTAIAEMAITALDDGDRVIKFDLLPSLRVTRVSVPPGKEIAYVQEPRKEDGSFYVILPEPMVRGREYKMTIEYEGNKVIEDAGGGNFAVGARTSWYPSVNSFRDRSLFDLTFKVPKQFTTVGVGRLVKEWKEEDFAASQWTTEIPLAVAGFNYGRFKKKHVTDSETKYEIEGYATSEVPDYLHNYGGALTPSRLTDNAIVEAQNSVRLFTKYFGETPYGRLAITQQPQFNFGQSWPTLIYLPLSAFLDDTQRWMLMGSNAFRFAQFIEEVTPHEVAHQWWGHMVGWASYHDQWLSEGFADFSAGLYLLMTEPKPDKYLKYWERARKAILDKNEFGMAANDAGPLWMGLRLNTRRTGGAYNRLVYPKGGYILHMLRSMMYDAKTRDQNFIAMMHDFVKTYYNQSASTEDFQRMVEKHITPMMNLDGNGRMDWFFDEWVYGTEVPGYALNYSLSEDGDKTLLKLTIEQSGVSPRFKMLIPVYLDFDGRPFLMARVFLIGDGTSKEFQARLPKRPKRVLINAEHDILASQVTVNGK